MDVTFRKRVPDEFGVIVPRENDTYWIKQGGGMSPVQREIEGLYIPIGKLKHNLGYPEWAPEGPNFEEKLRQISLREDIPQDDFERLPSKVQIRGNFDGTEEYFNWVENSEVYGQIKLYDDLRRFTYGIFDLLDSDPRTRWEDADDLWETIDDSFSFTYEEVENPLEHELSDEYPRPEPAIRWVRITGSKTYNGRTKAEWAEDLEGQVVLLMCPNAD